MEIANFFKLKQNIYYISLNRFVYTYCKKVVVEIIIIGKRVKKINFTALEENYTCTGEQSNLILQVEWVDA